MKRSVWPLVYEDLDRGQVVCTPELFGDVVLARRDVPASYHLCVTHDDAMQGVTLVARGRIYARPRTCTGCCRRLWGGARPRMCFIRFYVMRRDGGCPNGMVRRPCGRCAQRG